MLGLREKSLLVGKGELREGSFLKKVRLGQKSAGRSRSGAATERRDPFHRGPSSRQEERCQGWQGTISGAENRRLGC